MSMREVIWAAINRYAATCGGDTSASTVSRSREEAVALVEDAIRPLLESDAALILEFEAEIEDVGLHGLRMNRVDDSDQGFTSSPAFRLPTAMDEQREIGTRLHESVLVQIRELDE